MSSATIVAAPTRLRWVDVAKGACIVLVVVHHVVTKQYDAVVPTALGPVADAWSGLSHGLKPVRMPLFFVLSGFFASAAVSRPWSRDVLRRAAAPAYLYVVWLALLAGVFAVERELPMNRTQDLGDFALDLVFASTGLWFLYALAVYFVVARLAARVPTAWLVGVAAAVAAGASLLPIDEANRISVIVHFVHFIVGVRCPDLLRRIAADPRPLTGPLTAAFVGAAVVMNLLGAPLSVEIVLLSVVGVPWGLRLAAAAARLPPRIAVLSWVGRRTLPVYVLHMPVLAVVHHLGPDVLPGETAAATVLALGYPLLVSALIVAGCLGVHAVLVRVGLRALFELPQLERPRKK